jgi:hypothetical protein
VVVRKAEAIRTAVVVRKAEAIRMAMVAPKAAVIRRVAAIRTVAEKNRQNPTLGGRLAILFLSNVK